MTAPGGGGGGGDGGGGPGPAAPVVLLNVLAGGPTSVGSRNTPASVLVFGGSAPQFGGVGPDSWFFPTINQWIATHPPPPPPQGAPGGGGGGGGGAPGAPLAGPGDAGPSGAPGGGVGPPGGGGAPGGGAPPAMTPAMNQAIDTVTSQGANQALGGWGDSGGSGSSGGGSGSVPGPDFDVPSPGFDGTLWTGHTELGYDPVAGSNLAQPGDPDIWSSPLGGINDAPKSPSEELGYDPLTGSNLDSAPADLGHLSFQDRGYDPVTGSNLVQPGDLYSSNPSLTARLYSG